MMLCGKIHGIYYLVDQLLLVIIYIDFTLMQNCLEISYGTNAAISISDIIHLV